MLNIRKKKSRSGGIMLQKINKASEDIDELVGSRTKKINAKLKSFEELPAPETKILLETDIEEEPEAGV